MSVIIKSGTSSDLAKVNTDNELTIAPTKVIEKAGYAVMASMVDSGSLTGTPYVTSPEVSQDYRLRIGMDTLLMSETFNATAQYTHSWRHVFATMTATMAAGSLLLNANSSTVSGNGVQHSTWRVFPVVGTAPLYLEFTYARINEALANQIYEFGMFPHNNGTSAPTEGVYIRQTSAGLIGVINYNGSETPTGVLPATLVDNTYTKFLIVVGEREVSFWQDDILLATLDVPTANGHPFLTTALPISMQFRNGGTVTGSPLMQIKISDITVTLGDIQLEKPWSHILAALGQSSYQGQNGGTMGSSALLTNSLAAGAGAAMTNTAASLGVGLGGQFTTQPTLAAGTDGIVCSFQNPAGGVNQTPRTLYITSVKIQGAVTAALTGGPVLYAYSIAFGHTAVSLATAEAASFATGTTKAARRIPIGFETFPVTSAAGVIGNGVQMEFDSPIVVNPSEFVAIAAKNLGVVTSAGTITFYVTLSGYYE